MTIGVMLKGALSSGNLAIVPLDTDFVKPDISSIRESCDRELKMIYPLDMPTHSYEIVGLESVIAKIASCSTLQFLN